MAKIIGISGYLPDSMNLSLFWDQLLSNKNMVNESILRFNPSDNNIPNKRGLIPDIESFDPTLFGINNTQAKKMDPQIRMALDNCLSAILDAGIDPKDLRAKNIGVYSGSCFSDHLLTTTSIPDQIDGREMVGNAMSMIANRISYTFDFKGPSCNIDTACSSSLVALDKAFDDLMSKKIEWAIVIGSSLCLDPSTNLSFYRYSMLSPTGSCKTFDENADGYARSEGNVCLFITSQNNQQYQYSGYGKILGTGVNSDGFTQRGITYPSSEAQSKLYRTIYNKYNIDKSKVNYLEFHGTGTVAGDAEELKGVDKFFDQKLLIGSVKSNIGHTEGCSGLAGIVKILLSIRYGVLPANLHYNQPNQFLADKLEKFQVVNHNIRWNGGIIGVNSFGFGGTNSHVVLEGYHQPNITKIPIYKCNHNNLQFRVYQEESKQDCLDLSKDPQYVFVYTGMGGLFDQVGIDLLKNTQTLDLLKKLSSSLASIDPDIDLIKRFQNLIPESDKKYRIYPMLLLTSIQLILTKILTEKYQIKPKIIIGHSAGEIAAAYCDGCINFEQAIGISYARSLSILNLPDGQGLMIAVGMPEQQAFNTLSELFGPNYQQKITVACDNAPKMITVSGFSDYVLRFKQYCDSNDIFCKTVETNGVAFHSSQILQIKDQSVQNINKVLQGFKGQRSSKWISTVDGLINSQEYNADYILGGFLSKVNFRQAIKQIPKDAIIIEIGPCGLLKTPIKQSNDQVHYFASQKYNNPFFTGLNLLKKNLWLEGGINLESSLSSPPYLFSKDIIYGKPTSQFEVTPLYEWKPQFDPNLKVSKGIKYKFTQEICGDHIIDGRCLVPATGSIVSAWEVYSKLKNQIQVPVKFSNINIHRALIFDSEDDIEVEIDIDLSTGNFKINTIEGELVSSGTIQELTSLEKNKFNSLPKFNSESINGSFFSKNDYYQLLRSAGYQYGPKYQCLEQIKLNGSQGEIYFDNYFNFLDTMLQATLSLSDFSYGELKLPTKINCLMLSGQSLDENNINFNINKTSTRLSGLTIYNKLAILEGLEITTAPRIKNLSFKHQYQENFITYGLTEIKNVEIEDYLAICQEIYTHRFGSEIKKLAQHHSYAKSISSYLASSIRHNLKQEVQKYIKLPNSIILRFICQVDIQDYLKNNLRVINQFSEHDKLYSDDYIVKCDHQIDICLQIINENLPDLNFFEIGAGTGGFTKKIINILNQYQKDWQYTATDFFSGYLNNLKQIHSQINTQLYDINSQQTFKSNCIIALNSLHVCENLDITLNHLYNQLDDNGFLLIQENFTPIATLMWGMNSNLWNSTDGRKEGLWINYKKWISFFEKHQFTLVKSFNIGEDSDMIFLLKKVCPIKYQTIDLSKTSNDSNLLQIQSVVNEPVIFYDQQPVSGLYGLVKALNLEYSHSIICCLGKPSKSSWNLLQMKQNVFIDQQHGFYVRNNLYLNETAKYQSIYGYSLTYKQIGDLSSKIWTPKRQPFKEETIKVNVKYASLNFKDVMLSYGKLSKEAIRGWSKQGYIGFEMTGITEDQERVMGFALDSLANQVHTSPNLLWTIPKHWTFEQASTIPTVYSTAYYCLFTKGQIKPKHSVLIHAGTGGVGLAAIELALMVGCQVFTTCSSDKKRQFLLDWFPQLSSNHIGYSRDNSFRSWILEQTNGKGVDLIVNSLSEDLLQASLSCLAQHGKFLEIGKYDLLKNTQIGLNHLISNSSIIGVDLDQVFTDPDEWSIIHNSIQKLLNNDIIKPLPTTIYSYQEVDQAFGYLAKSQHIGKVLIDFENFKLQPQQITPNFIADSKKTYLIHGGLGGFGLIFLRWLVDKGAKYLIVTSRSGISTGEQQFHINEIQKKQVNIFVVKGDIGDKKTFGSLINIIEQKFPPVEGIFNLAMKLNDTLISKMDSSKWTETINSKILAFKNLHQWSTTLLDLQYFICWSSIVSTFGNKGQTNYALGNSYCDSLIRYRNQQNLTGLSIQWGAIGDVGFVSRSKKIDFTTTYYPQSILDCLQFLNQVLGSKQQGVVTYFETINHQNNTLVQNKNSGNMYDNIINLLGLTNPNQVLDKTFSSLGMDSLISTQIQVVLKKNNIVKNLEEISDLRLKDILQLQVS